MSRRRRPPPLPPREGAGVARLGLPVAGQWATVADAMREITGAAAEVERRLAAGEVVLADCTVVTESTTYAEGRLRGGSVWTYRELPDETPVPGEVEILYRDDDVLVVDKPPFLATMPRGSHVRESVVWRLREAGFADVAPAHRLDRLTSGIVLCTLRPQVRGAYQILFAERRVTKAYEAVVHAGADVASRLPEVVRSRIVKERGDLRAREVPGEPNAETRIEVLGTGPGVAHLRLFPTTGRTHQLRVHLAGLGTPIVGDSLYGTPEDQARPESFDRPLALLARELSFTDPLSRAERRFTSARELPWQPRDA